MCVDNLEKLLLFRFGILNFSTVFTQELSAQCAKPHT